MSARWPAAVAALFALGLSAPADDLPLNLDKKLKDAGLKFAKDKQVAADAAVREFKKLSAAYGREAGLTPAARADKMKATDDARKGFEGTGQFPGDDEYAGIALGYYLAVNKAYLPLNKLLNDEILTGIRKQNEAHRDAARKLLDSVEKQVPGTDRLTAGSRWEGTLTRPGGTIRYRLTVGKQDGNTFVGHVEDNVGVAGNWSYDLAGQTSGLEVGWAMTKSTRGKFNRVHARGVVNGDRLIAEVVSQSGKSAPAKGLLVLDRK